jgi:hypothetical protein
VVIKIVPKISGDRTGRQKSKKVWIATYLSSAVWPKSHFFPRFFSLKSNPDYLGVAKFQSQHQHWQFGFQSVIKLT